MGINYSKKSKVSFLLSTMILGAVSLSAVNVTELNKETLEINNQTPANLSYTFYLYDESQLINTISNNKRFDIEESENSSIINKTSLNVVNDWSAINAKEINKSAIINETEGIINLVGNEYDVTGIDVLNLTSSIVENKGNIFSDINLEDGEERWQYGIVVRNASNSSIKNTGTINLNSTGDSTVAVGIELDGWFAAQNAQKAYFNNSEVINDKNIILITKGLKDASTYGISTSNFMLDNSQIINNKNIFVSSESVNAASFGISSDPDSILDYSEIINNGTIKSSSSVINTTDNDNFAESYGILLEHVNTSKVINNKEILVNANNADKNKAMAEGISIVNIGSSNIENNGIVKSTINEQLDHRASSILIDDAYKTTLTNSGEGKLYGNIVLGGDINFNNKGLISLPYNANKNAIFTGIDDNDETFSRSHQPNLGNFVNTGTIEIGALKSNDNKIVNTQILTKTATFDKGSKMQVDVIKGSKAFVKGDTLSEVLTATDKLTINELTLNQTKLADNSALLDFEYKQENNKLDIVVSNVEKLSNTIKDKENNTNKAGVSGALDTIMQDISSYPQMDSLVSNLQSLSSDELDDAVSSLVPTTAAALVGTSSQINSTISNIVSTRLSNAGSGLNSGDEIAIDKNKLWAKVYGGLGKQKNKDSINGFDLKTYGLGLGYDREYKENQIIGFGAFYTNAKVEVNSVNHENDVDAYSIVAYGSNLLRDDKTTVYYQASHTWQKNDSQRGIFTGETAASKFTSKTLSLDVKFGHKINASDSVSFEPYAGLTYKNFKNPSYTESGAGASNIKSEKFSNTQYVFNVGTNFEYKLTNDSKLTALIGAGYDLKDDDNTVTSSFAGTNGVSFDTNGIDNGRWDYIAGIGYDVDINNSNNINLQYNYQGEGSKYSNNVLSVNYKYKF
ncbi:autotransporter outer membrane beta-barrel domain-containing protein [Aliarcobacter butzleri]|uniref:autotransporter outer membrane beta-barrel domain-containing protein n=1 Tax=Aliarcobacter butzleri TaxID=28197 RepID=UPI00125F01FD|nr:autotransporter outer membrane beta-barrel domain-containing protein [Aliarcobacter butzleri]